MTANHAFLDQLRQTVGAPHVLTEGDLTAYEQDWRRRVRGRALAVVRPGSTAEVAAVVRACAARGVAIVPQSGNTGLSVGSVPDDSGTQLLLSPAIYNPEPPADSSARFVKVFAEPNTDGAYSRTVWQSYNYPVLWEQFLAKKVSVPMYINSGDDDEFMIESEATQLYSLLRKNKQPAELRIVNGKHEWPVWESTVGDALKYVFRTVRRPQADQ